MEMHQHDSLHAFRFVLRGDLDSDDAQRLRWAWETARSVLHGKTALVEVSGIRSASPSALDVLAEMRAAGVVIIATGSGVCPELAQRFNITPAMSRRRHASDFRAL